MDTRYLERLYHHIDHRPDAVAFRSFDHAGSLTFGALDERARSRQILERLEDDLLLLTQHPPHARPVRGQDLGEPALGSIHGALTAPEEMLEVVRPLELLVVLMGR